MGLRLVDTTIHPAHTMLDSVPKKVFAYSAMATYVIAFLAIDALVFSISLFAASALALYCSMTAKERADKHQRNQMWFVAAAFYVPVCGLAYFKYQEGAVERRFQSYLTAHACVHKGAIVTGYASQQCDRWDNCADEHEIEEDEYLCRTTGMKITFKQFTDGNYGLPAK